MQISERLILLLKTTDEQVTNTGDFGTDSKLQQLYESHPNECLA